MPSCRLVVNTALRKLGKLGAGREARTADATDTLAALQSMYLAWIAGGAFGRLRDVIPRGASYAAVGGERIYREGAATMDVRLPDLATANWLYDYGWYRCSGYHGPTPRDGSPVVITDSIGGETRSWLYDGGIKRWQLLEDLTLDSEAPRSRDDLLGLASCLAIEVADQFEGEINPATVIAASRFKIAMTQRPGMTRTASIGVYV